MPADPEVFFRNLDIEQGNEDPKVMARYVWIGGAEQGLDLRTKTRTLAKSLVAKGVAALPDWNYDGSSTGQAPGHNSEVLLKPVAMFNDPFRLKPNVLVLCATYYADDSGDEVKFIPALNNNRDEAKKVFDKYAAAESWYGIEQEYLMYAEGGRPLGWPRDPQYLPKPQGPYYCSVGASNSFGRKICDAHYRACLYAGITISGSNAEVMPGQWEYQIGPCEGIASGDQVWMSRYILMQVAEEFGVTIDFSAKPEHGDFNGSGAHTNFSTKEMREDGGLKKIHEACEKLSKKHAEHLAVYGTGNELRLTGKHETASVKEFKYGVADRGASIRIPRDTDLAGKGYLEDRRPSANVDPYQVTAILLQTTLE